MTLPTPISTPSPDSDFSWLQQAACRGSDTALFFPSRGDTRSLSKAKAVCATCPVQTPCLQYALDQPFTTQGVYGGTSERQRRRMRLRTPTSVYPPSRRD